jgi:hypothetical protein
MRRRAKLTGGGGFGLALVSWAIDRLMPNAPDWIPLCALGLGVCLMAYSALSLVLGESENDAPIEGSEAWRKNRLAAKREHAAGDRERKRELIKIGRDLAFDYTKSGGSNFRQYLESQRDYADIRPHLSAEYLGELEAPFTFRAMLPGAVYEPLVQWFVHEIGTLERKWGLAPLAPSEVGPTGAESSLKRVVRAIALDNLRGRLMYADRVERSGDRGELTTWRAKAATQKVLGSSRLLAISPDELPEDQAKKLETAILQLEEVNQTISNFADGQGYQKLRQAAGMYRARGAKLYATLAEIAGIDADWRPKDE